MICFYHDDMDGRCAAYWVSVAAKPNDGYGRKLELIPVDYSLPFPMDKVRPNEQVYIVDFSIEPEQMRQLLEITDNVTWIDHHISAIRKYEQAWPELLKEQRGLRVDGVAGCVLTWIYLFLLTEWGEGKIKPFNESLVTNVPMFTRLIGDRDVWTWAFGERTKHFYAGLQLYNTHPASQVWREIDDPKNSQAAMRGLEDQGKTVEMFKKVQRIELIGSFAYETTFEGYKAVACNAGRQSSELFDCVEKEHYDLLIAYAFDGLQFRVSLYSDKINVAELAEKHGGGGHRGASGFQCYDLPFERERSYVEASNARGAN